MWLITARTENAKDTLCRNVTIYGHCRYEDKGSDTEVGVERKADMDVGCAFNHDPTKPQVSLSQVDRYVPWDVHSINALLTNTVNHSLKKRLNVDSPNFTPASLSVSGTKSSGISPKAAHAAVFKPKSLSAGKPSQGASTYTR